MLYFVFGKLILGQQQQQKSDKFRNFCFFKSVPVPLFENENKFVVSGDSFYNNNNKTQRLVCNIRKSSMIQIVVQIIVAKFSIVTLNLNFRVQDEGRRKIFRNFSFFSQFNWISFKYLLDCNDHKCDLIYLIYFTNC